jgi:hypothetical protein
MQLIFTSSRLPKRNAYFIDSNINTVLYLYCRWETELMAPSGDDVKANDLKDV